MEELFTNSGELDQMPHSAASDLGLHQGSGNFEIWIGPADDDDVINEPVSKKKNMYISPVTKTNDNWQSYNYNSF